MLAEVPDASVLEELSLLSLPHAAAMNASAMGSAANLSQRFLIVSPLRSSGLAPGPLQTLT